MHAFTQKEKLRQDYVILAVEFIVFIFFYFIRW
jgi:hypothetical protein